MILNKMEITYFWPNRKIVSQISLHKPENASGPTDQWLLKLGGPCQNQVVSDQRTTANVEACKLIWYLTFDLQCDLDPKPANR
jgi:hypothetical protein